MLNRLPLPLFGIGLVLLYIAERTLSDMPRYIGNAAAGLALFAALAIALLRWRRHQAERRQAYQWVLFAYMVAALGLAVYGLQSESLGWLANPQTRDILQVTWPALILLGLLPAVAMELAIASMEQTPTLEIWRVSLAARAARIVGLAIVAFAGLNFAAATWNRHIDLSYFKTTRVGTATQQLVENLSQPVQFTLFFPPGSEVLSQTRAYIDELAHYSKQLSVDVTDQALEPERARELKIRSNGYLVVQSGKNTETLRIDLDAEEARETLRGLDGEVHKRLLKVIEPARIAYFSTGHGERDYAPPQEDKRPGLGDLKALLEGQGFTARRLGLGEGLGTDIPGDASLVLVIGPQDPFTPPERASLQRYLNRGGRALLAMDPDHGHPDNALLAPLGVQVSNTLVAHKHYLVRVEGHGESPYDLATNRASSHPSVMTLEQYSQRFWVGLLGTGFITKTEPTPTDVSINFTLHAMPQSWEDKNGNGKFDQGSETYANFDFAAAIEKRLPHVRASNPQPGSAQTADANTPAPGSAPAQNANMPAPQPQDGNQKIEPPPLMRALVIADADFLGNGILRNPGNAYLAADAMRWLANDDNQGGVIETEKDIPLIHRKDDDALWFYGASFIFPAAVLVGGLMFTKRGSRKRRSH